ncbi:hypothetical protein BGLA2_50013 [Burkholderia gladioli]|nr:hypothetical protein BGLA2_50013 [Burkholderia gladioli]
MNHRHGFDIGVQLTVCPAGARLAAGVVPDVTGCGSPRRAEAPRDRADSGAGSRAGRRDSSDRTKW